MLMWCGTMDYCSLYRGKVGLDAAEAHHLMEGLDWQGAVKDIDASVKWLKDNGSPKVSKLLKVCRRPGESRL